MTSICSPNWFSSSLYLQEQLVCNVAYSSSNAWSLVMKFSHFPPAITLFPCEGEKSGDLWELVQLKCTSRANTVQLCLLRFCKSFKWCISWSALWSRFPPWSYLVSILCSSPLRLNHDIILLSRGWAESPQFRLYIEVLKSMVEFAERG